MATTPLQEHPRLRPAGNDEIRGRALVAHIASRIYDVEAQLAEQMPATPQLKPISGSS